MAAKLNCPGHLGEPTTFKNGDLYSMVDARKGKILVVVKSDVAAFEAFLASLGELNRHGFSTRGQVHTFVSDTLERNGLLERAFVVGVQFRSILVEHLQEDFR